MQRSLAYRLSRGPKAFSQVPALASGECSLERCDGCDAVLVSLPDLPAGVPRQPGRTPDRSAARRLLPKQNSPAETGTPRNSMTPSRAYPCVPRDERCGVGTRIALTGCHHLTLFCCRQPVGALRSRCCALLASAHPAFLPPTVTSTPASGPAPFAALPTCVHDLADLRKVSAASIVRRAKSPPHTLPPLAHLGPTLSTSMAPDRRRLVVGRTRLLVSQQLSSRRLSLCDYRTNSSLREHSKISLIFLPHFRLPAPLAPLENDRTCLFA